MNTVWSWCRTRLNLGIHFSEPPHKPARGWWRQGSEWGRSPCCVEHPSLEDPDWNSPGSTESGCRWRSPECRGLGNNIRAPETLPPNRSSWRCMVWNRSRDLLTMNTQGNLSNYWPIITLNFKILMKQKLTKVSSSSSCNVVFKSFVFGLLVSEMCFLIFYRTISWFTEKTTVADSSLGLTLYKKTNFFLGVFKHCSIFYTVFNDELM